MTPFLDAAWPVVSPDDLHERVTLFLLDQHSTDRRGIAARLRGLPGVGAVHHAAAHAAPEGSI